MMSESGGCKESRVPLRRVLQVLQRRRRGGTGAGRGDLQWSRGGPGWLGGSEPKARFRGLEAGLLAAIFQGRLSYDQAQLKSNY